MVETGAIARFGTGLKKNVKSLVNACKSRKLVSVCLPCISVEIRVDDFRIREKVFANIQAWVNTVVLTPVSCPEGVWAPGEIDLWFERELAINSSQITHKSDVLRCHHESCDCRGGEVEVVL